MKEQFQNEDKKSKISPKLSFIFGILAGITLTSFIAFVMTFSLLKSAVNTEEESVDTGEVAGVEVNANTAPTEVEDTAPPSPVDIKITDDDYVKGNKDAKVSIIEYSDFQCPYCGRQKATVDQILADYGDQVSYVFRHFPLSFHENAQKAGEAYECAAEQGKFWEMHNKLFENQSDLSVDNYKAWAKELGLNTSIFNDCLDSGKYTDKVKNGLTDGTKYGVQGTPATFINGQLISGAQPYENFKAVIDSLL